MIAAFVLSGCIAFYAHERFYMLLFAAQAFFSVLAVTGWMVEKRKLSIKVLFIPYYFCVMNYAVIAGIRRYMMGTQSAVWEKAKRK
jgi:hypothetical protein